ncbi:ABC transporter permease subunit [Arcanobacterium hippocoleae]
MCTAPAGGLDGNGWLRFSDCFRRQHDWQFTITCAACAGSCCGAGFLRFLVPGLRAIDPRMREAARTLGATPWQVLRTIDLPYLLRGLGLALGFAFAISLGEFGATSFLANPDYLTLPVVIVKLLSRPGADNYGMALAGAVILALATGIVMMLAEFLGSRGSTESCVRQQENQ